MASDRVRQFLDDVTRWASAHTDILALALVGTYARTAATETSDVDLVFITVDPDGYLGDQSWVQRFGIVEKSQIENYGRLTSLRVWYRNGLEIEYGLTDERWTAVPLDAGTQRVIGEGMRILFERGNLLSRHLPTT